MITTEQIESLLGKEIVALTRQGQVVRGKLTRRQGDRLFIRPSGANQAHTSAFTPLVLYDLLAIGMYGGYGGFGGFGGFGGYGGYGGFGYPGFLW